MSDQLRLEQHSDEALERWYAVIDGDWSPDDEEEPELTERERAGADPDECGRCGGSGGGLDAALKCPSCHGSGLERRQHGESDYGHPNEIPF
jgi:hypothetical protein